MSFLCSVCGKSFATNYNLARHSSNAHQHSKTSKEGALLCSFGCDDKTIHKHSELIEHLKQNHDFQPTVEEITFASEDDFLNWKYELRKKFFVEYIKSSSTKTLADGSRKMYLTCHRSQTSNRSCTLKNTNDRKRAYKSQGSSKITKSCPSRIEVVYNKNSTLSVKHWKDHLGHPNELGHSTLHKSARDDIARRLKDGVSLQHILDVVRSDGLDDDPRTLLLDRKDLHNVVRDYNIAYETRRHTDDGTSVQLWVEEMENLGDDSPVVFYKKQGDEHPNLSKDDFFLVIMTKFQESQIRKFGGEKICIDGTHGTNAYDFSLHTLLTVDEFGSGCPVAYCFSNKDDQNQMTLFFEKIKERVGTVVSNAFMSDDAPAYFNAWCQVMSPPEHKLLCSWHVDRCWRKNLSKVKGGILKKEMVYKTLKVLMQSLTETDFQRMLKQTLADLMNDKDTIEFGEYFMKFYASRPKQWAYCFRAGIGINTNMYLESMHKTLKHVYLEGKKVKRLDKTINAVMKMARDSLFKRLIKLSKHSPSTRTLQVNASHKASAVIGPNNCSVMKEGEEWSVASSRGIGSYVVTKCLTTCEEPCIKCVVCNICVHSYKCTCTDNVIKMNICKHIHACCRLFNLSNSRPISHCKMTVNPIIPLIEQAKLKIDVGIKDKISQKLHKALDFLDNIDLDDPTNSRLVESKVDGLLSAMNSLKNPQKNSTELEKTINVNSKIQPQVRLYSSKKKSCCTSANLSKPTLNETVNIIEGLMSGTGTNAVNIHTGNDHTYNVG